MAKGKKDGKGDVGHKRGSSLKGGDLNSWKESDMQMPGMNAKSKKYFAFKIHSFLLVYM